MQESVGLLRSAAAGAADLTTKHWWLVVDPGAHPDRGLVDACMAALADGAADACYTDFRVGESPVAEALVGGWSKERARWQDYCGAAALVRAEHVMAARQRGPDMLRHFALVRAAETGGVRYLPEARYRVAQDVVTTLSTRQRALVCAAQGVPISDRAAQTGLSVSVVIPTRGGRACVGGQSERLVDGALESLLATTRDWAPQVVLVVDTDVSTDYVIPWQQRLGDQLVVVGTDPPFNFSRKVNEGARAATGEILVIVNDDVSPVTEGWLHRMAELALEPDVGAVGAMLLYEDGTIQHAGLRYGGGVHHLDRGGRPGPGPRARNACDRDVTGVTAACLVQRRSVWEKSGGLDEAFPVSFNDVDYCWRLRRSGLRVVQANTVQLHHYESKTRQPGAHQWEVELLTERLGQDLWAMDELSPVPTETVPEPTRRDRLRCRLAKARRLLRESGLGGLANEIRSRGRGPESDG